MQLSLNKQDFLNTIRSGEGVPPLSCAIGYNEPYAVYEGLLGSRRPQGNSILLESVKGPHKIARYSFIALDPYLVIAAKNGELTVHSPPTGRNAVSSRPPLERLGELVTVYPQRHDPGLPPFQGGAAGMLSYDFVRYIERIPGRAVDDLRIPDAHFLMADRVIAFDHMQGRAWVIVAPGARATELGYGNIRDIDWDKAYEEAAEVLQIMSNTLLKDSNELKDKDKESSESLLVTRYSSLKFEMSMEHYMDIARRAKEYIAAGDIFQANLSQRISADIGDTDPWEIYKVLRRINPSPFAAYADFGSYQIASSSPERLVKVVGGVIETRPIAGTRPRGKDLDEDELMRSELLLNEKERAEHIMLIDLERNDIGRVAEYGSVAVDELMITEDYSHVMHIVSNVKGIIARGKSCFDLVKAAFPGGTITGVPKVRCMEIIDELEPVARGPYTGSLGYIGYSGNMDLNIIIRTFVIKDRRAYVQAGAGIVADSDPEREYHETMKKAEALLRTLGAVDPL